MGSALVVVAQPVWQRPVASGAVAVAQRLRAHRSMSWRLILPSRNEPIRGSCQLWPNRLSIVHRTETSEDARCVRQPSCPAPTTAVDTPIQMRRAALRKVEVSTTSCTRSATRCGSCTEWSRPWARRDREGRPNPPQPDAGSRPVGGGVRPAPRERTRRRADRRVAGRRSCRETLELDAHRGALTALRRGLPRESRQVSYRGMTHDLSLSLAVDHVMLCLEMARHEFGMRPELCTQRPLVDSVNHAGKHVGLMVVEQGRAAQQLLAMGMASDRNDDHA